MEKHISQFISSSSSLKEESKMLLKLLQSFSEYNFNEGKSVQRCIPLILDKIFSLNLSGSKQIDQSSSMIRYLNQSSLTFEDLDIFFHVLCPKAVTSNLFSLLETQSEQTLSYEVEISNFSSSVQEILKSPIGLDVTNRLSIFKHLCSNSTVPKGKVLMNCTQYFLYYLVLSGKREKDTGVPLKKLSAFKQMSFYPPKLCSNTLSKYILDNLDLDQSAKHNFYRILFKKLLEYYSYSSGIESEGLQFILAVLEATLMSDYTLSEPDSQMQAQVPNSISLQFIKEAVEYLQTDEQLSYKYSSKENGFVEKPLLITMLHYPLFHFFKGTLSHLAREKNQVKFYQVSKIWYSYITPWERGKSEDPFLYTYYIACNIAYYTELLQTYLNVFAEVNNSRFCEIQLFYDILKLYRIENNLIINRFFEKDVLAMRNQRNSTQNITISNTIESNLNIFGLPREKLWPFDLEENRERAKHILLKIKNWTDVVKP